MNSVTVDNYVLAVLTDVREHGAEAAFFLEAKLGKERLKSLLEGRYLTLQATPAGSLITLGPAGRQTFGLSPNYLSPPEVMADQYLRRRCVAALQTKGWTYTGRVSGTRHVIKLQRPNGRVAYLFARWKRVSARSARRVFDRLREFLIREDAVLLIHTDRPHTLAGLTQSSCGRIKLLSKELYWKTI